MPLWLQIIIVTSTFAGLIFAAFGIWHGSKVKQAEIGMSMNELQNTVAEQQKQLEAAEQRFQNLEAIVTNQMWDVVHEQSMPEIEKQRTLSRARIDLDLSMESPSDADQVSQIANRLKN